MHTVFKWLELFCIFDACFPSCSHSSFKCLHSFVKIFDWLLNISLLYNNFLSLSVIISIFHAYRFLSLLCDNKSLRGFFQPQMVWIFFWCWSMSSIFFFIAFCMVCHLWNTNLEWYQKYMNFSVSPQTCNFYECSFLMAV